MPGVGIKGGMGNEEMGMRNGNGGMEMRNGNRISKCMYCTIQLIVT